MKKLFIAVLALSAVVPVYAQNSTTSQNGPTAAEVKAQGKVDQTELKADKKIDKALTDEARTDVKADAKATDQKLKAHNKAHKQIDNAVVDVDKAETNAGAKAARANK